jgi:6-phosphogluconolactonase
VTPRRELEVVEDSAAVGRRGAEIVREAASEAVARRGTFAIAVSGGRTPVGMFRLLAGDDALPGWFADPPVVVPGWSRWGIWQVDERVAPDGHPDRNLTALVASLPVDARAVIRPMPVTEPDLDAAAARYAASLPAFDLVHLGLGDDGHTASLVPGDPALDVVDRDVALTGEYRGRRRMTLTYPVLDRAPLVLWLVAGEDKAAVLPRLLEGDPTIPAGRVRAARQLVVADRPATAT